MHTNHTIRSGTIPYSVVSPAEVLNKLVPFDIVVVFIYGLFVVSFLFDEIFGCCEKWRNLNMSFAVAFIFFTFLLEIYLTFLLHRGMKNSSSEDCERWVLIRMMALFLSIMSFVFYYLLGLPQIKIHRILLFCFLIFSIFLVFYRIFEIVYGKLYLRSLKSLHVARSLLSISKSLPTTPRVSFTAV